MPRAKPRPFELYTVDELTIDDERSFRHVGLYADLKEILRRAKVPFRVMSKPSAAAGRPAKKWPRADHALLLNLTYWGAEEGGDILPAARIDADVVAHAAWHHLAAKTVGASAPYALFLGEAIASAFDVYLVGRLLGHAPRSSFLETQVPAMAESAEAAGLGGREFEALLAGLAADPEGAFEELRELLWDATTLLHAARDAEQASTVLADLEEHRFASLLHRYALSNWVLYARAYRAPGRSARDGDARAERVDVALREAESAIDWLTTSWVAPALR